MAEPSRLETPLFFVVRILISEHLIDESEV
jgi:hypothetical protein